MRHKDVITAKIEQVHNSLTSLDSQLSRGTTINEAKEAIEKIKEKLADIQTLINTQSDSWN